MGGAVNVDGAPLENGDIAFAPLDGNGVPVTGKVEQGKYSLTMSPGKKLVQISAPKVVRREKQSDPSLPDLEFTEETLPERYHAKSELQLDVTSSTTKDWDLESKK